MSQNRYYREEVMKVGIPKGLMYCKYHPFLVTFFSELGAEIIVSEDTNKNILDAGVKYCVDDACLPVKVFHGHVDSIKDKCDVLVIPRIMQLWKNEYICPKFCGLPEMVINSFDKLPVTITEPIYATSKKKLYCWAKASGKFLRKNNYEIKRAFINALNVQSNHEIGINNSGYEINIALTDHPYNIYDSFYFLLRCRRILIDKIFRFYRTNDVGNYSSGHGDLSSWRLLVATGYCS